MTEARTDLSGSFDASQQAWYKAVAGVFARVQKKDVADIPLDIWRKLIRTTYDGIDVNPLYTRAEEHSELNAPGEFPYTRGHHSVATKVGWGVTESFGANATNAEVLHALENGTTDLVLYGEADIAELLKGVYVSMAPVRLNAGSSTVEKAAELYRVADSQEAAPARLELGASPLSSLIDGSPSVSIDDAVKLAVEAAQRENTRAILVDGVSFSNQGASDAQEIGLALAAGVEYLRALTAAGLNIQEALDQISFRFAVTDDQFAQIAKLRVARRLWARVAEVVGAPEHGSAPQHALTAPVMFSQRDPWVNMLRSTVAAFAGGVGGATDVEVLVFDWAIPGGLPKTSRAFAHRIARNTNLLLLEESHLGHVVDPAGGSYYLEDLTEKLSEKAWDFFTSVEHNGGFSDSLDTIKQALDETHEAVRKDIAYRRKQLTAINEFPNLAEAPLAADLRVEPKHVRRWAAEFESFRNRSDAFQEVKGHRPRIALIPLGPLAKHNIRTGFTTNLLASGGIEALNPGQVVPGTEEFTTAAKESPIVVICGTDAEYAESGPEAVKALREAGVETILLAGPNIDGVDVDDYLNMKIDAAQKLTELLEKLGA
ncbi:Methylmalonyl-CoA mutase small subunit [Corynebacterium kutscheri]|uniref:Methylmalonyl-CoA mutase small subunit n=1 Tax=Corynebacterium kutscheri TaxID=35755 RepID=A0A0F6TDJ4_9CORY|nr:methylmalonyl-CoA mutase family protein [Corynebacterium kutscheri]AKE41239.1 methylmalonyl-CoA mutase, N-terminal domain/subunit [Corynebacterium kutscheri]VEH08515.1 Methylmalonyl-CoA mutase small subunit [Corynebacterium kutscheri]VEH09561.1 Methylmalonyl-CoA mutase small subunit [Corynebacterium kutscheri]VEH79644.1 Methylmalonyl-CoA mutase small subunit [Corynebacterium kutscheri]